MISLSYQAKVYMSKVATIKKLINIHSKAMSIRLNLLREDIEQVLVNLTCVHETRNSAYSASLAKQTQFYVKLIEKSSGEIKDVLSN